MGLPLLAHTTHTHQSLLLTDIYRRTLFTQLYMVHITSNKYLKWAPYVQTRAHRSYGIRRGCLWFWPVIAKLTLMEPHSPHTSHTHNPIFIFKYNTLKCGAIKKNFVSHTPSNIRTLGLTFSFHFLSARIPTKPYCHSLREVQPALYLLRLAAQATDTGYS